MRGSRHGVWHAVSRDWPSCWPSRARRRRRPAAATAAADPSVPGLEPAERADARRGQPADRAARLGVRRDPLQVTLANTNGCPVTTAAAGVPVTFSAPASGASGTFAASGSNTVTVGSDASGMASGGMFSANGSRRQLHDRRELGLRLGLVRDDEHRGRDPGDAQRARAGEPVGARRDALRAGRSRSGCSTRTATPSRE